MRIAYLVIFFFLFLLGGYLGVKSYIKSRYIFSGKERRVGVIIADSALAGLSASLLFFSAVFFYSALMDPLFQFTRDDLLMSLLLFLTPGVVIFLGSLWQYFQVGVYREGLSNYIREKWNNKKRK